MPAIGTIAAASVVGFLGYGTCLALFIYALRHLGTARTSAYFSSAPFVGAILAVAVLGEPVTGALLAAGTLMAIGLWLHIAERHDHEHEAHAHEHLHVHDDHHKHDHAAGEEDTPHVHAHSHTPLMHEHPHYPDVHHRHERAK